MKRRFITKPAANLIKALRCLPLLMLMAVMAGCSSMNSEKVAQEPIGDGNMMCTQVMVPAMQVSVTDMTGQPVCGAKVMAIHNANAEPLSANGMDCHVYEGRYEQAGQYDVSISAAGFKSQLLPGVHVAKGACHVETQRINVTLKP
ncbi:carboxypeptidase-like regulatory domain-containing protein [Pokkaliibacter sp. CJK22405]|uniref:carboxypeptidase-like regulatory domain-containing protein n=1 Tax=Pokkaliibacter sp. CJK22405 TaxID=3384615 RepID=UPI00398555D3